MAEPEQLHPMPAVVIEPAVENPISGPSHESQPLAATIIEAPTVTASTSTPSLSEPIANQSPLVVATECPNFGDAQTLIDFDINDTNLSEPQIDLIKIRIPGFTLYKEVQETILSIHTECK
jgi:hypothetical protein